MKWTNLICNAFCFNLLHFYFIYCCQIFLANSHSLKDCFSLHVENEKLQNRMSIKFDFLHWLICKKSEYFWQSWFNSKCVAPAFQMIFLSAETQSTLQGGKYYFFFKEMSHSKTAENVQILKILFWKATQSLKSSVFQRFSHFFFRKNGIGHHVHISRLYCLMRQARKN